MAANSYQWRIYLRTLLLVSLVMRLNLVFGVAAGPPAGATASVSNTSSSANRMAALLIPLEPGATPSPTVEPLLVGHVTWQGIPQPNMRSVLSLSLTLKMGGLEVNYPPQSTDVSGFFTVPVGALQVGGYNCRVKGLFRLNPPSGSMHLASSGMVELFGCAGDQCGVGLGAGRGLQPQ